MISDVYWVINLRAIRQILLRSVLEGPKSAAVSAARREYAGGAECRQA